MVKLAWRLPARSSQLRVPEDGDTSRLPLRHCNFTVHYDRAGTESRPAINDASSVECYVALCSISEFALRRERLQRA